MRRWLRIFLLLSILLTGVVRAQAARVYEPSAQDILNAVNALRASRGLAAYTVDAEMMAYAQQHSEYQAATGNTTHTHSDGTTPWEHGLDENIAVGSVGFITIDFIINQVWADAIHMKTMVGYASGGAGVGVAYGDGLVYYTLDVNPSGGTVPIATSIPAPGGTTATQPSSGPVVQPGELLTSTPLGDGSIFHEIRSGETLWSIAIAYGVTVQQIRDFNVIPENATNIYVGQKLLIKLPGEPYYTPTPTATETSPVTATVPATETPLPTFTVTPAPTRTLASAPTATQLVAMAQPTQPDAAPQAASAPATPASVRPSTTNWLPWLGGALLVLAAFGLGVWVGMTFAARRPTA